MKKKHGSRQLTQHINHHRRLKQNHIPLDTKAKEFVKLHQELYPIYGDQFVALYQERVAPEMEHRTWGESLALLKEIGTELKEGAINKT